MKASDLEVEYRELLEAAVVVRLATISGLGDPFNAPALFHFDGESVYVAIPEGSQHLVNLRGNRRVCILADALGSGRIRGVAIQGLAQFVRGQSEANRVLREMEKRYADSGWRVHGTLIKVTPVAVHPVD